MNQIILGKLDGWAGWRELRDKLGWNHCLAVCVSLVRLFLWHLMQPAVYASVLFYYEPQIDRVQFHLGVAVLAREASYVLLILYALCTRPAFLLVNLDSHRGSKGRLRDKIMYVLSPEKFLSWAALGGDNNLGPILSLAAAPTALTGPRFLPIEPTARVNY